MGVCRALFTLTCALSLAGYVFLAAFSEYDCFGDWEAQRDAKSGVVTRNGQGRCQWNVGVKLLGREKPLVIWTTSYEGNWKANMKEGKGTFRSAGGTSYTGDWRADMRHGTGILQLEDETVYNGTWKNDRFTSAYASIMMQSSLCARYGVILDSSEIEMWRYEGPTEKGLMHGTGTIYFPVAQQHEKKPSRFAYFRTTFINGFVDSTAGDSITLHLPDKSSASVTKFTTTKVVVSEFHDQWADGYYTCNATLSSAEISGTPLHYIWDGQQLQSYNISSQLDVEDISSLKSVDVNAFQRELTRLLRSVSCFEAHIFASSNRISTPLYRFDNGDESQMQDVPPQRGTHTNSKNPFGNKAEL